MNPEIQKIKIIYHTKIKNIIITIDFFLLFYIYNFNYIKKLKK